MLGDLADLKLITLRVKVAVVGVQTVQKSCAVRVRQRDQDQRKVIVIQGLRQARGEYRSQKKLILDGKKGKGKDTGRH